MNGDIMYTRDTGNTLMNGIVIYMSHKKNFIEVGQMDI